MQSLKLSVLVLMAFCVQTKAAEPALNFDQNIDLKEISAEIRENSAKSSLAVNLDKTSKYIARSWYTRECARFTFTANTPLDTETVWLNSQELVEDCGYNPRYNPHYQPPYGSGHHSPDAYNQNNEYVCVTRPGYHNYRKSVRMMIGQRQLLPWEQETFEACLEGPFIRLSALEKAYEYRETEQGNYNISYSLTPVAKLLTNPDPAGIFYSGFPYDQAAGTMKLSLGDKWAQYYQNEKAVIKVELKKDEFWFLDSTVLTREIEFASASSYEINLADYVDLKTLKPGKYFVTWGFKRISGISNGSYQKVGDTVAVEVK